MSAFSNRRTFTGLITGLIGLSADLLALAVFFRITASNEGTLALYPSTFAFWIIILVVLSYTILILNFYTRRVLLNRHRRKQKFLSYTKTRYIENAVFAITGLVGILLLLPHLIVLFYIISERLHQTGASDLEFFFGSDNATGLVFYIGSRWFLLAPLLSFLICLSLHLVAEQIHSAVSEEEDLDEAVRNILNGLDR